MKNQSRIHVKGVVISLIQTRLLSRLQKTYVTDSTEDFVYHVGEEIISIQSRTLYLSLKLGVHV
jgi:hypothetical protein